MNINHGKGNVSAGCRRWSPWSPSGAALLLALFAAGASAGTVYGPPVELGDGVARTYQISENGRPVEIGVALDEAFMAALPQDGAAGGIVMPDGHSYFEYVLEMPEGNGTPFRHVTLDWNPVGHEPPGIYDEPHFDIHFYTITDEERQAISPADPQFMAKAGKLPAAEFIPRGYVDLGLGPVPRMGVHLLDPGAPELRAENPAPFTHTFIYGSWNGRLIFIEPMVTVAFLAERPDITIPVATAERYEPPGYYPGSYTVRWDEATGEYRIALTDLRRR